MVVLGIFFNTINMTISISPDRVDEIQAELDAWGSRAKISHKQHESLIRKLQFASQVIRAGHVFLAHLLDDLRGSYHPRSKIVAVHYANPQWYQVNLLGHFFEPGALIDMNAMLVGAGGVCKGYYFNTPFCEFIVGLQQTHIIAHLELLAFIVFLKA